MKPWFLKFFTALVQLAQPIRLLLAYTGTDYEDVKYQSGGRKLWKMLTYFLYSTNFQLQTMTEVAGFL